MKPKPTKPVSRGINNYLKDGQTECYECSEPLEDQRLVTFDEVGHAFCGLTCAHTYLSEIERVTEDRPPLARGVDYPDPHGDES